MKFSTQIYKINDIIGWDSRKELILSPKFQRRSVWNPRGKSYLIDSIIKGFALPPFFIREKVLISEKRTIREVVDGQQRIRTILEYISDKFTVLKMHNLEFAKTKFSELPDDIQEKILSYSLSVNVIFGLEDAEIFQMFSRLNAYSVPLNNQEKLNAEFIGEFKQTIDELAKKHLEFWRRNKILTEPTIARMKEIELTAELVISMISGLQDSKKKIRDFYKKYDDDFSQFTHVDSQFEEILGIIDTIFDNDLSELEFKRVPIFYSLFCSIYNLKYGFGNIFSKMFTDIKLDEVKQVLFELNENLGLDLDNIDPKYSQFISSIKSSTDGIKNRQIRHEFFNATFQPLFV